MGSCLVRGKYVICKVTGPTSALVVSDGAVFQRNGLIVEVGRYSDLKDRYPHCQTVGSTNHVVLPGFVNDHFHIGLTPFQLGAPDLPLELWAFARWYTRDVDPYLDHLYGAVQMIESGTTSVQVIHSMGFDKPPPGSGPADQVIKAYLDAGMRVSYAISVNNQNRLIAGPAGGDAEFVSQLPPDLAKQFTSFMSQSYRPIGELVQPVEEICQRFARNGPGRVRITVAPSNVHRCSDDLLMALKSLAGKYTTNMHIHLQETLYQKLYGLHRWGKTPLRHLYDLGFLGNEVVCGHGVWLTEEDIELMADTGTSVCHNASSNLRLQGGIAPVPQLLQKGIKVALGTDEAGINDDKDMLQEMRLVLNLHRVPGIENRPLSPHQVFQMATVDGANAAGFANATGTLEPGKQADMVLLSLRNIEEPYLDSAVDTLVAIVHRGRASDVETVIIDGEIVMQDYKLTRVDKESLFRELKASLSRPLSSRELARRALGGQLEPYLRQFYEGALGKLGPPQYGYNGKS